MPGSVLDMASIAEIVNYGGSKRLSTVKIFGESLPQSLGDSLLPQGFSQNMYFKAKINL